VSRSAVKGLPGKLPLAPAQRREDLGRHDAPVHRWAGRLALLHQDLSAGTCTTGPGSRDLRGEDPSKLRERRLLALLATLERHPHLRGAGPLVRLPHRRLPTNSSKVPPPTPPTSEHLQTADAPGERMVSPRDAALDGLQARGVDLARVGLK